jgi:hypothetical protein
LASLMIWGGDAGDGAVTGFHTVDVCGSGGVQVLRHGGAACQVCAELAADLAGGEAAGDRGVADGQSSSCTASGS